MKPVQQQGSRSGGSRRRYGLFDVMRIGAALGVIFSHSFALEGHHEPTLRVGAVQFNFGALCVAVFFCISGFLIAGSWDQDPSLVRFVRKRFARIAPGLFVCLVVTALVVGPFVTTLPVAAYLRTREVWTYVVRGSTLYLWRDSLPGVFQTNPFPVAVDGPLWTLPYEVLAYSAIAVLGLVGGLKRRWPLTCAAAIMLAALVVFVPQSPGFRPTQALNVEIHQLLILWAWFFLGALLFVWEFRPTLPRVLVGVALVAGGLIARVPIVFMSGTAVLVISMGSLSVQARAITRFGDPSYGIYIYGWLVQQVLVWVGLSHGLPMLLFDESAVASVIIAYASWHLVERPAMQLLRPNKRPMASVPVRVESGPSEASVPVPD